MGTRDLEKEVPNLKRNLENSHDPLTNLKTEHSSLKIYSHELETKIQKLEKVIGQRDSKIAKMSRKKAANFNQNHLGES